MVGQKQDSNPRPPPPDFLDDHFLVSLRERPSDNSKTKGWLLGQ
jgi:hypothetical protein